jgi:ATP-dependent DNA helicase RecQ
MEKTKRVLERLDQMDVIEYLPQNENPQLVFATHRHDSKDLNISKENYQYRKEAARRRLDAVKDYVGSRTRCRSQILLEYFGEKDAPRCGKCDVCRQRNKLQLSEYEFDLVLQRIKPRLQEKKMTLEEVVSVADISNENKVLKVLQWLMDHQKVVKQGIFYSWR